MFTLLVYRKTTSSLQSKEQTWQGQNSASQRCCSDASSHTISIYLFLLAICGSALTHVRLNTSLFLQKGLRWLPMRYDKSCFRGAKSLDRAFMSTPPLNRVWLCSSVLEEQPRGFICFLFGTSSKEQGRSFLSHIVHRQHTGRFPLIILNVRRRSCVKQKPCNLCFSIQGS